MASLMSLPCEPWPVASRDYLAIALGGDTLVVTCDSTGGIGSLELDVVKTEPQTVGRFLARVGLMELIVTGAHLTALSFTSCTNPLTSLDILQGVYAETRLIHPAPEAITVSTSEKNIATRQTGVGLTCIGVVPGGVLRSGCANPEDLLLAVGRPKMGAQVRLDDPENADLPLVLELLSIPGVGDISPAGSKGILYEACAIANAAKLRLEVECSCADTLHSSAGPATAVVVTCAREALQEVTRRLQPVIRIGKLTAV